MNTNATAQMVTTTQVGCGKPPAVTVVTVEMFLEEREKLKRARDLLFAVQPFCEAWAAFDLADDIKDFLDGRKSKVQGHDQEPSRSAQPSKHKGGEKNEGTGV